MATVRLTGNTPRNIHKKEWLATLAIDASGRIERSLDCPEIIFQRIEAGIAQGSIEGTVTGAGWRIDWFLDRGRNEGATGSVAAGEGI